jgi:hypothetical protein
MAEEQQPYVIPTRQQIWRMFAVFVLPVIILGVLAFSLAYFLTPPTKQVAAPQSKPSPQDAPAKNNEPASGSAY